MVNFWYPLDKAEETGKIFISGKLPDYAEGVELVHMFFSAQGEIEGYSIYKIENDKLFEGLKSITTRLATYRSVEGYRYKLIPLLEAQDCLPMIGLGK